MSTEVTGTVSFDNPMMRNTNDKPKKHPSTTGKQGPNGIQIEDTPDDQTPDIQETHQLRKYLKLYFYSAIKWKGNSCSIHLIYVLVFILQTVKVTLVTTQMFRFGHDRANFSSVVNRGHLTLRHLLLRNWDATWETLPYPPSRGDFAVYRIKEMEESVNYAVEKYYNAEREAIGYYIRQNNDTMMLTVKLFDFVGFRGSNSTSGIDIRDLTFEVDKGLKETTDPMTNETVYTYSILEEFSNRQLSLPIKRLLSLRLDFSLHSVRVSDFEARCLHIHGWIEFVDLDNNGQVVEDLETLTTRIECAKLNFSVPDLSLEYTSPELGSAIILLCLLSLLSTLAIAAFAIFVIWKTKTYMSKYYRQYYRTNDDTEKDLPMTEYLRFIKLWYLIVILSDVLTLYGTITLVFEVKNDVFILATLDSKTVWLSLGCLLNWVSLLRFLNFHNKVYLLFKTLYRALLDVSAYLVCVCVLFVGFWTSGYVVMGPYHVKFSTPSSTAETLFSVVTGDELYTTLNILETKKIGGNWVWWFSRVYMGAYVAIFTVVVINLLIAIVMSAYESIKEYYADEQEERDLGPVERALKHFLEKKGKDINSLRASIYNLMSDDRQLSTEEYTLRMELKKIIRLSSTRKNVVIFKPRTLKAFMEDETDARKEFDCCFLKCWFIYLLDRNK